MDFFKKIFNRDENKKAEEQERSRETGRNVGNTPSFYTSRENDRRIPHHPMQTNGHVPYYPAQGNRREAYYPVEGSRREPYIVEENRRESYPAQENRREPYYFEPWNMQTPYFGYDDASKRNKNNKSNQKVEITQRILEDKNDSFGESQTKKEVTSNIDAASKVDYTNKDGKSNVPPTRVVEPVYQSAKLTILLVENSVEVAKLKDKLDIIVKSLGATSFIYVINYGSAVRENTIVEANTFSSSQLLCEDCIGDKMCLYDALSVLKDVVKKYYNHTEWLKFKKVKITSVDIIGIGRGVDNCSIASFETAISDFNEATLNPNVVSKYFCLTEESFINVATIGFHSIGAIAKSNT